MSLENITASYANGKATVKGKKQAGDATIHLYVGTSTTEAGQDRESGTNWSIGPFDLAPGTYTITLKSTYNKEIFFTLTVPAPAPPQSMVSGITETPPVSPLSPP